MSMPTCIYQIVGYKNRGKTNLICRLIDYWHAKGESVATIKHDAHDFEFDRKGTDTWLHRHSGASWTAITSGNGTAIVHSRPEALADLLQLAPSEAIILVEGFKQECYPKLVLIRCEQDLELLQQLKGITAVALWPEMWEKAELHTMLESQQLAVFELDDTDGIAAHTKDVFQAAIFNRATSKL